jgi:glycosyltransferase involved in cell wall biosynthesis
LTTDRPRLLWVTEERPDRKLGGGSVRQAHLLEAIGEAMAIDLLITGRVEDPQVRAAVAGLTELEVRLGFTPEDPIGRRLHWLAVTLLSPRPWYAYGAGLRRRALARVIRERRHDYDLVCIEHETLAPLIPSDRSGRWILTLHQIVSSELEQELRDVRRRRRRWLLSRDMRKAQRMEAAAVGDYDQLIVCSAKDAAALAESGGSSSAAIAVVPNGVDLSSFRPTPLPPEPRVLFPGAFHFPPNIHGSIWLCSEIWPRVREAVPDATLELVGREPDKRVLALRAEPSVEVVANVPSMAPYFERARVVVVPLRVGSGTRLKAVEAMACARPVVGTAIGLDGLDVNDGVQARLADDPEPFADAIIEVLKSDRVARGLGDAGRAHVEARFGWDRIGSDYARLLSELAQKDLAVSSAL